MLNSNEQAQQRGSIEDVLTETGLFKMKLQGENGLLREGTLIVHMTTQT